MFYCKNCGSALEELSGFCPHCGYKLSEKTVTKKAPEQAEDQKSAVDYTAPIETVKETKVQAASRIMTVLVLLFSLLSGIVLFGNAFHLFEFDKDLTLSLIIGIFTIVSAIVKIVLILVESSGKTASKK